MRVYLVKAFTLNGVGGNGAGVVPCEEFPPQQLMQRIAKEMGCSETVFISKMGKGYESRFFTPQCEVDLCGHATIAGFYMMAHLGSIPTGGNTARFKQRTRAGRLTVRVDYLNGRPHRVFMQQSKPVSFGEVLGNDRAELCRCLGLRDSDLGIKNRRDGVPEIISTGLPDIIVPVLTGKVLASIGPDFERLARLSRRLGVVSIHVFTMDTQSPGFMLDCRNFGPVVGIDEETATGTANGALGYYLHNRSMLKEGRMVSRQGAYMGSPSAIHVKVSPREVWVGGEAVILTERLLPLGTHGA